MERRTAMAFAAMTSMILSTGTIASAAVGGLHLLGFGTAELAVADGPPLSTPEPTSGTTSSSSEAPASPLYMTRYEVVTDYVTMPTTVHRYAKVPATAAPQVSAALQPSPPDETMPSMTTSGERPHESTTSMWGPPTTEDDHMPAITMPSTGVPRSTMPASTSTAPPTTSHPDDD